MAKSTGSSWKQPGFVSQHSHGGSQLSVTQLENMNSGEYITLFCSLQALTLLILLYGFLYTMSISAAKTCEN